MIMTMLMMILMMVVMMMGTIGSASVLDYAFDHSFKIKKALSIRVHIWVSALSTLSRSWSFTHISHMPSQGDKPEPDPTGARWPTAGPRWPRLARSWPALARKA